MVRLEVFWLLRVDIIMKDYMQVSRTTILRTESEIALAASIGLYSHQSLHTSTIIQCS